jgi:hypothetical protein
MAKRDFCELLLLLLSGGSMALLDSTLMLETLGQSQQSMVMKFFTCMLCKLNFVN